MANKKYIIDRIDGVTLDLPDKDPTIDITYVNPCKNGPGTIAGNRSTRSEKYPVTKTNDSVFENWWLVGEDNTPTAAEFKPATREVNGVTIFRGKAQLKKATMQGGNYRFKGKEYSVAYFSGNADWFLLLKDKELGRDLDWSIANHVFSSLNISLAWNATFSPTQQYAYGIIKWKDWAYVDAGGSRVDVFESTPLLSIKQIFDKIFSLAGYTWTSNFFDLDNGIRYVIPVPLTDKYPAEYGEDYLNVEATKVATQSLPGGGGFNIMGIEYTNQTKAPAIGPNPYTGSVPSSVPPLSGFGTTSQYIAPDPGFYEFKMTVTLNNISSAIPVDFGFTPAGVGITSVFANGSINISSADNGKTYSFSTVAQLEAGAVIQFFAASSNNLLTLDITGGTLKIIGEATIGPGSNIDFKYLLRDWKITDFIKGVAHAFNLCFWADNKTQTIYVEPKDPYLYQQRTPSTSTQQPGWLVTSTNDINNKVDLKKLSENKAVNQTAEQQLYEYKEDGSDETVSFLNENEPVPIGAAQYNMPANRFKQSTKKETNPFFAATLMHFDETIRGTTSQLTPCIPIIFPVNFQEDSTAEEANYEVEPRILWFGGQREGLDGQFRGIVSTDSTPFENNIPALFFVNYNDDTGEDVNLSFSDVTLNGILVKGAMSRYYLRDMARLRVGKTLTTWMYWNTLDILSLDFRNKVLIDGNLYVMQEIQGFSPIQDRSTKTVFVLDAPDQEEDRNAVENALQGGVISGFNNPDK